MVYHRDADHSLHMALSRDPHIYRVPDSTFYVVTSATLATAPPNVPTSQNRSTVLSLKLLRQRRNDWRSIGNSTK